MTPTLNHLSQPVGPTVPHWRPPERPSRETIAGSSCRLESLDADRHARSLFDANRLDAEGKNWTYLPYGPFDNYDGYRAWIDRSAASSSDPLFFAIVDAASDRAVGVASYLRIDPANGAIEIGHLNFSPLLQRNRAATEALALMIERVFALGYRRCEWKCDALNAPSRRAATRLGFSFEGIFRQAVVVKGRNRDTAWFSITDGDWSLLQPAYRHWLSPENFDEQGRQRAALSDLTRLILERTKSS